MIKRLFFALIVGVYLGSGFYSVGPSQRGVETFLGRVLMPPRPPGLHYHAPWPFGRVTKIDVSRVRTEDVRCSWGFGRMVQGASYLLTGDENVVQCSFQIHYIVYDPVRFLYFYEKPGDLIKRYVCANAVDILANMKIDDALTVGRPMITSRIKHMVNKGIRELLGIDVTSVLLSRIEPPLPVKSAFAAVSSAKADAQRMVEDAMGQSNRDIPKARSQATRTITIANAKARELLDTAKGDLDAYYAALKKFNQSPDQTRLDLYIDTLKSLMNGLDITVVDPSKVKDLYIGKGMFLQKPK